VKLPPPVPPKTEDPGWPNPEDVFGTEPVLDEWQEDAKTPTLPDRCSMCSNAVVRVADAFEYPTMHFVEWGHCVATQSSWWSWCHTWGRLEAWPRKLRG